MFVMQGTGNYYWDTCIQHHSAPALHFTLYIHNIYISQDHNTTFIDLKVTWILSLLYIWCQEESFSMNEGSTSSFDY